MLEKLFGNTFTMLEKALDIRHSRHKLIASNIANAETPGYRAVDISFEDELRRQTGKKGSIVMVGTDPRHITPGAAGMSSVRIVESPSGPEGLDGNTVNLESEMVRLAENSLMYNISTRLIKRKFKSLMNVIKEGGK